MPFSHMEDSIQDMILDLQEAKNLPEERAFQKVSGVMEKINKLQADYLFLD